MKRGVRRQSDQDPCADPKNPPRTSESAPARKSGPPSREAALADSPPRTPKPPGPRTPPAPLLKLEKPFDIDEFSHLLGENRIRATVPREALAEVLRRVVEFMGFGVYVYAVVVLPAPSATLDKFIVELDRIDFDAQKSVWVPFREKGVSSSPFGPASESGR
jgi:hypothetical protein